jgi:holo-[acyl-carrier protein] synthase
VEVTRDAAGAPKLALHGAAAARAAALEVERAHLSISHAAGVAMAVVILEM